MKFAALLVSILAVASNSGGGGGGDGSFFLSCNAAFVPSSSMSSRSSSSIGGGFGNNKGGYYYAPLDKKTSSCSSFSSSSSALNLDNLPKSLSDMEMIPTPPNMDSVKDKLSSLSSTLGGGATSGAPLKPAPPNPPPPFDPTDPEALIAITKSFIATDFGIQSSLLPNYSTAPPSSKSDDSTSTGTSTTSAASSLPFYSSTLLSPTSFLWISSNNLEDGRTGPLNKEEYLAAGRYFDLRKSFPDLEYRAHDFRVLFDEGMGYSTSSSSSSVGENSEGITPIEKLGGGEITVRFTTRTTGTFRGAPLRLRSMVLEPNGKVMKCPPTSISITYSTQGTDRGKMIKLVTDMVLDRQSGNTNGLSGIPAAAIIGGAPQSSVEGNVPPLVALGRLFGRPLKSIDEDGVKGDGSFLAPFPESVMIQLAKGVLASNLGLNDPNLLAEKFTYIEPLMGPMDKEKYLEVFSEEFNVREGVPDLDYGLQNFRVDPYDPYRVWVDFRATGTRTGAIGKRALPPNVNSAPYEAPPEAVSFTFDDDGFCTRLTAAAVLDPLLGNTGGLGGVYGLLYATGTPVTALKTRSLSAFLSRASKSLLRSVTGLGPDGWKMSDGRVVNGLLPSKSIAALPPESPPATPVPKPFFAAEVAKPPRPTIALPKPAPKTEPVVAAIKPPTPEKPPTVTKTIQIKKAEPAKSKPIISESPADPVTDALNSAFGITAAGASAKPAPATASTTGKENKAQQLRNAAQAARAEAAEAKKKAAAKKAQEMAERQAAIDAQLEKQKEDQLKRQQLADEAAQKKKEAMEAMKKKKEAQVAAAKQKQTKTAPPVTKLKGSSGTPSKSEANSSTGGGVFSFFQTGNSPNSKSPSKTSSPTPAPKSKSAAPVKRSPTISLFGSPKPKTSSSKPSPAAKPKAQVKGTSAPVKRSPTISLFGTSTTKTKTATSAIPKKSSKKSSSPALKAAPNKSPTLNIFGIGGAAKSPTKSKSNSGSAVKKTTKTKRPTLSLTKSTTSKTKSKPDSSTKATATRSPTFSLFGGAKKDPSPVTSTQAVSPAKKTSSGNNSPFGGFFGGGSANSSKGSSSAPRSDTSSKKTSTSKAATAKTPAAPKGVPTVKQWKQVNGNAVEGRIYGSKSFRDGAAVTTSPISSGKLARGSVVVTSSGSKYFLE